MLLLLIASAAASSPNFDFELQHHTSPGTWSPVDRAAAGPPTHAPRRVVGTWSSPSAAPSSGCAAQAFVDGSRVAWHRLAALLPPGVALSAPADAAAPALEELVGAAGRPRTRLALPAAAAAALREPGTPALRDAALVAAGADDAGGPALRAARAYVAAHAPDAEIAAAVVCGGADGRYRLTAHLAAAAACDAGAACALEAGVRIEGAGHHRTMSLSLRPEAAGGEEFRGGGPLTALQILPRELFVDVFELGARHDFRLSGAANVTVAALGPIDLEAPVMSAAPTALLFAVDGVVASADAPVRFEVPVHLRYAVPGPAGAVEAPVWPPLAAWGDGGAPCGPCGPTPPAALAALTAAPEVGRLAVLVTQAATALCTLFVVRKVGALR